MGVQKSVEVKDDGDWEMELFGSVSPERRYEASIENIDSTDIEGGGSVRRSAEDDWYREFFGV